jgi:hypothetical protein
MIVALGDEDVALAVESQLMRHVQCRVSGRTTIAAVCALAVSGDRPEHLRLQVEPAHTLVVEIAEIERAVGPIVNP